MTTVDNRKVALKYLLFLATSDSFGVANGMPIQKRLASFVDAGILAATVDDVGTSYTLTELGRIVVDSIVHTSTFFDIAETFRQGNYYSLTYYRIMNSIGNSPTSQNQVSSLVAKGILRSWHDTDSMPLDNCLFFPTPLGKLIFSALA